MTYPLTVAMTPAFYFDGDWLFKAQLKCLSEQTNKDFDVLLVDPHYSKRKNIIWKYAEDYELNLVHVPYKPNPFIAKKLDCAIFNAPYLYSESPRIVRYSCWRFVRPDWTDICLNSTSNVDFYFHNCSPPTPEAAHPITNHNTEIFNFGSDEVHWDKIPELGQSGCSWGDSPNKGPELFPVNCYGNYMVFRKDWLSINGCNEVFTNLGHYEDQDFCLRAKNAGITCSRIGNKLYRLHHWYGSFAGRANTLPDHSFKQPCANCEAANLIPKPKRFDLYNRKIKREIEVFGKEKVWVCKTCFLAGPEYSRDESEHTNHVATHLKRATVLPKYMIGRNLQAVVNDMDGKSLEEKIKIFEDSYSNPKYY